MLFFLKNLLNEGRAAYTLPKKNHNILLKICINTCSSTYLISIKVNVRCACNNLKKEWICQDVLKEYRQSGRDPKQIPKNQYAVGLLACGEDCVKKVKAADSELHLRKIQEIKVLDLTI